LAGKDAYPLPAMTLPSHSMETLTERLRRFEELCAKHDVVTRNTRIDRYRRYLERPPPKGWELDRGVFIDPPKSPIQHGLDRLLYVLRELHELTWIGEGLRDANTRGLADKLRIVVRGADFAALDRNTESRNTQFELRIASYLGRAGYRLDFGTLTDIVATRGLTTYYVECKRVASTAQLARRIKEALEQIEERKPRSGFFHGRHGVVAADVTRVAFTHNGLTLGVTPDHARDVIREKLQSIEANVLKDGPSLVGRRVVGLWLQIHIPSLVLHPPMPTTRFSSLFLGNPKLDLRSRCATRRFVAQTLAAGVSEPGDEVPQLLQARNSIQIPRGTGFTFDEELLEALVATGELPERADDHLVLTVRPPGAEDDAFEYYSYFELKMVFGSVSAEDRRRFTHSLDWALFLLGPLILQRYRYVGHSPWLDGGGRMRQPARHPPLKALRPGQRRRQGQPPMALH